MVGSETSGANDRLFNFRRRPRPEDFRFAPRFRPLFPGVGVSNPGTLAPVPDESGDELAGVDDSLVPSTSESVEAAWESIQLDMFFFRSSKYLSRQYATSAPAGPTQM